MTTFVDTIRHDVRYALRTLTKSRGFTALAVATLGIGLGANTSLFSLVDALLLRSLPVSDPAGLVLVQRTSASGKGVPIDAGALQVIRGLTSTYRDAALVTALPSAAVTVDNQSEPARQVFRATANFFSTLGVTAQAGRLQDAGPVAVISDRFWQARFARDRSVVGRAIDVNGSAYPIAGVAAPGFLGVSLDSAGDIWLLEPQFRGSAFSAMARLAPGVSITQAAAATAGPLHAADLTRAGGNQGSVQTVVVPGGQGTSNLRERYRAPLLALMGLVVLVLLITCANLANLLVVRNLHRAHELNVRTALGAGRLRLVRQLLIEGLVLAVLGSAAGWLCAHWGVALLLSTVPAAGDLSRLEFHADPRVLSFMIATTLLTTLGFVVLPAWRATGVDVASALRTSPAQAAPGGARRLGLLMVGAEVALSVVLLAGAALFVQTVRNAATMPLGFDRRHLVEVELADRVLRLSAAEVRQAHSAMLESVRALPGVENVALAMPLFPSWAVGVEQPDGESGFRVSADYFSVMKIPLLRGRLLTADDLSRADPVVVANEWYARSAFPGEDAIGKRGGFNDALIVGIVGNARDTNVRWETPALYRLALPAEARLAPSLIVRTAASIDPESLFKPIAEAIRRVDPRLFVAVRTPDEALNRSIARERMVAATSGFFGLAGLVLAGMGLFGVAASAVAHRTRELGLRLALGASRWNVVREALRGTGLVFAAGLATGIATVAIASRAIDHLVAGLLIGLRTTDWAVVGVAAMAMLVAAALASILPALRAARVDPLTAIRSE
jgi:putative ABC transport system permease protein